MNIANLLHLCLIKPKEPPNYLLEETVISVGKMHGSVNLMGIHLWQKRKKQSLFDSKKVTDNAEVLNLNGIEYWNCEMFENEKVDLAIHTGSCWNSKQFRKDRSRDSRRMLRTAVPMCFKKTNTIVGKIFFVTKKALHHPKIPEKNKITFIQYKQNCRKHGTNKFLGWRWVTSFLSISVKIFPRNVIVQI